MGQEEPLPFPGTVVVVASWEPAVNKAAPAAAEDGRDDNLPPESPRKAKAPTRRLSVPPPPGRPSVPGSRSLSRGARAVRPEDDPFLAAYLACTRSGGGTTGGGGSGGRWNGGGGVSVAKSRPEHNKGGRTRRFTWAGLGLSCKGSGAAVEQSMVKLAAKRPELDPRDA